MPDDPRPDPFAAPAADPGRPDPAPSPATPPPPWAAAPPAAERPGAAWPAAGDGAALNPLAPGAAGTADTAPQPSGEAGVEQADAAANDPSLDSATDPSSDPTFDRTLDPTLGPPMDPTLDPAFDPAFDPSFDPTFDPAADPTFDPTPESVFVPFEPDAEGAAGALPEWPAPAPARVPSPADDWAPAPSAAAPSRPSVPWDPHQDGPPVDAADAPPGRRVMEAIGANALSWGAIALVLFLALTALFYNVFTRAGDTADSGPRPNDEAASAAALDTAAPDRAAAPSDAPASNAPASDASASVAPLAAALQAATARSERLLTAPPKTDRPAGLAPGGGAAATQSRPSPARAVRDTAPPLSAGADTTAGGAAPADRAAAEGVDVNGAFIVPAGFRRYDDAQHGFSLRVPTDWREARRSSEPGDAEGMADYDVVFEAAGGEQRLAVSVWGAGERPPFESWLPGAVTGMQPLDDGAVHGEGVPYNGFIGGEPALVLGASETPVSHLAYAAFLQHGERYLRVAWADMTGLTRPDDILGALASFGWVGDDLITGSAAGPNQVPRLVLPQGAYWPSERLFGEDGR